MTLQQWLMLLLFWANDLPVSKAAKYTQVSSVDVFECLRGVCSQRLINDGPPQLGGNGAIVEVDELCFSHKPKV